MIDIDKAIYEKGYKKKYIAEKLDIRPETLSRKLSSPETFSAIEMGKLSLILGVRVEDLNFNVIFFTDEHELNSSLAGTN